MASFPKLPIIQTILFGVLMKKVKYIIYIKQNVEAFLIISKKQKVMFLISILKIMKKGAYL